MIIEYHFAECKLCFWRRFRSVACVAPHAMQVPMTQEFGKRLKLDDVARAAKVSRATAWRAINQPELVTERTVGKVTEAIRRIGYVPDMVARTFRQSESSLLPIVLPTVGDAFSSLAQEIASAARAEACDMLVGMTDYDADTEFAIVQAMLGRRVPAMLITGTDQLPETRRMLERAAIPVVQLWEVDGPPIDMMVGFSNFGVGRAAARHLIETGRRNIAMVLTSHRPRALRRHEGFREELRAAGLPCSPAHEIHLTTRVSGLDGVFVNGDLLALRAIRWCHEKGIRVPEDVGILGFEALDFSAEVVPRISTIRLPVREMGRLSAQLVFEAMRGERPEHRIHDLGFEVLRRDTT